MAEIEIQYIVPSTDKAEARTIATAMNSYRQWTDGELDGDWLVMDIGKSGTQISLSREVLDTRNHAEVQEVGESMRRGVEATFDESERQRLAGRFAGFAIYSADEELAVE